MPSLISTRSMKRGKVIVPTVITLVLLLSLAIWWQRQSVMHNGAVDESATSTVSTEESDIDYSPPTEEEVTTAEDVKINRNNTVDDNAPVAANEVEIISVQQDPVSKEVVVKTKLNGTGWQKCKLNLSNETSSFFVEAETLYQSEFSTCLGFSIPVSDFKQSGRWAITLTAEKSGQHKSSSEKTINIEK